MDQKIIDFADSFNFERATGDLGFVCEEIERAFCSEPRGPYFAGDVLRAIYNVSNDFDADPKDAEGERGIEHDSLHDSLMCGACLASWEMALAKVAKLLGLDEEGFIALVTNELGEDESMSFEDLKRESADLGSELRGIDAEIADDGNSSVPSVPSVVPSETGSPPARE